MADSVKASVWLVKENQFGDKTYTNVMLSDEKWYGLGGKFEVQDGDGIVFDYEKNEKGFLNAVSGTVVVYAGKGNKMPDDKKKTGGGAKSKGGWSPKGQPEEVQAAIVMQSAHKAAVDLVIGLVSNDALALGAKKGAFDNAMGFVANASDTFFKQSIGVYNKVKAGTALADLVSDAPVEISDSFDEDSAKVEAPVDGADFVATEDVGAFD